MRLFSNRGHQENVALEYTWAIKARPRGSRVTVQEPIGITTQTSLFEYVYGTAPTFSPDQPGDYILVVEVKAIFAEGHAEAHVTVQHEIIIKVTGPGRSYGGGGGCSIATENNETVWIVFLFGIVAMMRLRRRAI